MRTGFEVVAAKSKKTSDDDAQPTEAPMKPLGQIRRNPDADQKKARRQLGKTAGDIDDITEGMGEDDISADLMANADEDAVDYWSGYSNPNYYTPSFASGDLPDVWVQGREDAQAGRPPAYPKPFGFDRMGSRSKSAASSNSWVPQLLDAAENGKSVTKVEGSGGLITNPEPFYIHIWFDGGTISDDFGNRVPDSGIWEVDITDSADIVGVGHYARQEFRLAEPSRRAEIAAYASGWIDEKVYQITRGNLGPRKNGSKTAGEYTDRITNVVLNDGTRVPDVMGTDPSPGSPGGVKYVGYTDAGDRVTFTKDQIKSVEGREYTYMMSPEESRLDFVEDAQRRTHEGGRTAMYDVIDHIGPSNGGYLEYQAGFTEGEQDALAGRSPVYGADAEGDYAMGYIEGFRRNTGNEWAEYRAASKSPRYSVGDNTFPTVEHFATVTATTEAEDMTNELLPTPSAGEEMTEPDTRTMGSKTVDIAALSKREAQLIQAMKLATREEQRDLVIELEQVRQSRTALVNEASEIEVADMIVRDHLSPRVAGHENSFIERGAHSVQTDWIGDVIDVTSKRDISTEMAREASAWFGRVSPEVRADADEFGEQAKGMARVLAGRYGDEADYAQGIFLDHVGHLVGGEVNKTAFNFKPDPQDGSKEWCPMCGAGDKGGDSIQHTDDCPVPKGEAARAKQSSLDEGMWSDMGEAPPLAHLAGRTPNVTTPFDHVAYDYSQTHSYGTCRCGTKLARTDHVAGRCPSCGRGTPPMAHVTADAKAEEGTSIKDGGEPIADPSGQADSGLPQAADQPADPKPLDPLTPPVDPVNAGKPEQEQKLPSATGSMTDDEFNRMNSMPKVCGVCDKPIKSGGVAGGSWVHADTGSAEADSPQHHYAELKGGREASIHQGVIQHFAEQDYSGSTTDERMAYHKWYSDKGDTEGHDGTENFQDWKKSKGGGGLVAKRSALSDIEMARKIVESKDAYAGTGDFVLDMQTANAIVTVYDALKGDGKEKFANAGDLATLGSIAWKLIGKTSSAQDPHLQVLASQILSATTGTCPNCGSGKLARNVKDRDGSKVHYCSQCGFKKKADKAEEGKADTNKEPGSIADPSGQGVSQLPQAADKPPDASDMFPWELPTPGNDKKSARKPMLNIDRLRAIAGGESSSEITQRAAAAIVRTHDDLSPQNRQRYLELAPRVALAKAAKYIKQADGPHPGAEERAKPSAQGGVIADPSGQGVSGLTNISDPGNPPNDNPQDPLNDFGSAVTTGQAAADVSSVPTPGGASGYPQPSGAATPPAGDGTEWTQDESPKTVAFRARCQANLQGASS